MNWVKLFNQGKLRAATTLVALVAFFGFEAFAASAKNARPNILLIVADDLSYASLGYAGGVAPDVTPNIDALYEQSISFEKAFSTVAVCQPSRQSMLTGLMPHNYGSVGFFPIKNKVATLPALLGEAGYVTGAINKITHMLPQELFGWDYFNKSLGLMDAEGFMGRNPDNFAQGLTKLIEIADEKGVPFFMVANSSDPHRPFHGDPLPKDGSINFGYIKLELKNPSRIYSPEEVTVPAELPDLPAIRADVARYASSVRRLDDTVGACLGALEKNGKADSTIVVFVSDNGMPMPFGKFDTYLASNRSPFLIRFPGKDAIAKIDDSHLVSLLDVMPTLLEFAGVPVPDGLDGKSLVPLIEGDSVEDWRDGIVFLRYEDIYYTEGLQKRLESDPEALSKLKANGWKPRPDHPAEGAYAREKQQRCYFDGKFGYIFYDWFDPDGLEKDPMGLGVPYGDNSFRAIRASAKNDEAVSIRLEQYLLRSSEELFDWTKDPASHVNLVDNPEYASQLKTSREKLQKWMEENNDSLLPRYREKVIKPSEN